MKKVNENEEQPDRFVVYRKCWYGEKVFCICDEVQQFEECILMRTDGKVIAILPKNSFSCAISMTISQ